MNFCIEVPSQEQSVHRYDLFLSMTSFPFPLHLCDSRSLLDRNVCKQALHLVLALFVVLLGRFHFVTDGATVITALLFPCAPAFWELCLLGGGVLNSVFIPVGTSVFTTAPAAHCLCGASTGT